MSRLDTELEPRGVSVVQRARGVTQRWRSCAASRTGLWPVPSVIPSVPPSSASARTKRSAPRGAVHRARTRGRYAARKAKRVYSIDLSPAALHCLRDDDLLCSVASVVRPLVGGACELQLEDFRRAREASHFAVRSSRALRLRVRQHALAHRRHAL